MWNGIHLQHTGCGAIRVRFGLRRKMCSYWIHSDVLAMVLVIPNVSNPMVCEACLPYGAVLFQTIRESSFNELHGALKGDLFRRCEQRVDVVRHNDEFVKKKFSRVAILCQRVDQESGSRFAAEYWQTLDCDRGDKEDPVEVHFVIVVGMEEIVCERCHKRRWRIPKR